jgi:hypothetical protein
MTSIRSFLLAFPKRPHERVAGNLCTSNHRFVGKKWRPYALPPHLKPALRALS